MDKINEKIIDKLFDKYRYPSNGFDNLETNLQLFEDNILWNPMSSIDDIGFPKELLQNPARIRPSDEFLIGFERISLSLLFEFVRLFCKKLSDISDISDISVISV